MNVQNNVLLARYSSLNVGGPAATLIELEQDDSLQDVLKQATQPVWVLGFGTNSLISDKGLPGTVIINGVGGVEDLGNQTLRVDSGVAWDTFVQKAIELGLYGLEFTSGIPGSVGAAVAGSIAAYGHRVGDRLLGATVLDLKTGTITSWDNEAFEFSYRSSSLQKPEHRDCVVLDATFLLSQTPTSELEYDSALKTAAKLGLKPDSLQNRRTIILETRQQAGSLLTDNTTGPWTAGSFFKNPLVNEKQVEAIIGFEEAGVTKEQLLRQNKIHGGTTVRVSAAHVLLAAGFKRGQSWGNVRLHPDHILKIENSGQATAQEIYDVVQEIVQTVKTKLDITLEPEVRFLGDFS